MAVIEEKRAYFAVPSQDEIEALGLTINRVGTTWTLPHYRKVSGGNRDYTFLFIRAGRGTILVRDQQLHFSTGDIVVIQQGTVCEWWSDPESPLSHYWIGIEGEGCRGILGRLGVTREVQVLARTALPAAELEILEAMLRLLRERPPQFLWKLHALFFELCHSIAATTEHKAGASSDALDPELVKRFIDSNYAESISVAEIAKTFGITVNQLSRYFRAAFGLTPYAYLVAVRMERSKELLKKGCSVKETALSVGYADPNYFSRLFRKKTGHPPTRLSKRED